jgi:hypothetical protein
MKDEIRAYLIRQHIAHVEWVLRNGLPVSSVVRTGWIERGLIDANTPMVTLD